MNRKICALLFLLAVFAHIPQLLNGFTDWDDPEYITQNNRTQSSSLMNVVDILNPQMTATDPFPEYQPVRDLSLMIDWNLWGGKPFGFHLTNLLLHAANAVLLFMVLMLFFGNIQTSFIAAALFAIHPVHVESVAWAASRKDTLGLFFVLCTIYFFIRSHLLQNKKTYLLSILFFVLALLSKSHAVTTPAILGLWLFWKNENRYKSALPFFGIAAFYVTYFLWIQFTTYPIQNYYNLGYEPNGLAIIRVFVFYLKLVFWPFSLSPYYDLGGELKKVNLTFGISVGVILLYLASLFYEFRKRSALGFGLILFAIQLLPVLNFLPHPIWIADRYIYFAAPFLYLAIADGVTRFSLPFLKQISIVLALGLTVLTWRQTFVWKNSLTLWNYVLTQYPNAYPALVNLGNFAISNKDWKQADIYFSQAIQHHPAGMAAWLSGGIAKAHLNKLDEAIRYYNEALRRKPNSPDAYFNMGLAYEKKKERKQAILSYEKCLGLNPKDLGCKERRKSLKGS